METTDRKKVLVSISKAIKTYPAQIAAELNKLGHKIAATASMEELHRAAAKELSKNKKFADLMVKNINNAKLSADGQAIVTLGQVGHVFAPDPQDESDAAEEALRRQIAADKAANDLAELAKQNGLGAGVSMNPNLKIAIYAALGLAALTTVIIVLK